MAVTNLNKMRLCKDDTDDRFVTEYWNPLKNHIRINDEIELHFDKLEDNIIRHIKESDTVLGCVAWLTNKKILEALQNVKSSIIVQKEDFLRPDSYKSDNFTKELKEMYKKLIPVQQPEPRRWSFEHLIGIDIDGCTGNYSIIKPLISHIGGQTEEIESVRCLGNINTDRNPAFPRMHHKFMIFLKRGKPNCVWTGSFNMTYNGTNSLENAVVLTNPDVVVSYINEWSCLLTNSENLNWNQEWCAQFIRFGS